MSPEQNYQSPEEPPEHDQSPSNNPYQENPFAWTGGDVFSAILHEKAEGDKKRFSVQVSDGQAITIVEFNNTVQEFRISVFPATEAPAPLLAQETPGAHAIPAPQSGDSPVLPPAAPAEATSQTPAEQERKPTVIVGKVTEVTPLDKTAKQQRPVLRFAVHDEQNRMNRRIVAFDTIAEGLAAPETGLTADAPIKLLAWKHVNTIHIQGQERQVEEWYPQKVWYADKVFEKPKPKRRSR